MRSAATRAPLAASGVLLGGLLVGCGGGAAAPTTPASTATSPTAPTTASPSATASVSPSTSPTPSASAASGPLVTLRGFTLHLPEGWVLLPGSDRDRSQAYDPTRAVGTLQLESYEDLGDLGMGFELKQAAASARTRLGHRATREPDRVVNGVTGYVFSGSNAGTPTFYQFSTVHEHYVTTVTFLLTARLDDPQGFVDAVLDSLTFTTPPPPS